MRIFNFTELSERVLRPFSAGVKEVLNSALGGESSVGETATLPEMLDKSFVAKLNKWG